MQGWVLFGSEIKRLISLQAKWRTASSWEEFYEENHLEVKRHFGEITGQETE